MSHTRLAHRHRLLIVPGVILIGLTASTVIAQAQSPTPEEALTDQTLRATYTADTPFPIAIDGNRALSNQSVAGPEASIVAEGSGEQALLGQVNRTRITDPAGLTEAPVDGARALLGKSPSAISIPPHGRAGRSSFYAEVRGGIATSASGDAEFGAVENPDRSSSAFVMSLGVCGPQSAILFTRRSGTPLGVGRYRISEAANGADEILALLLTGAPTRPTGVFRGQSGWLVVTATPDRFITGRFQLDATGFVVAEPRREDRHVSITGSFSATPASSSFRVCDDAE
jgi:hypothetical protein